MAVEALGELDGLVPASDIRFSQTSVNGSKEIIDSMKKEGWKGRPIDVVVMDGGAMTTLDNTRVVAARAAGIEVQAIVHGYDEPPPDADTVRRFATKKGVPRTWGEATVIEMVAHEREGEDEVGL